jgi:hypothetical protein
VLKAFPLDEMTDETAPTADQPIVPTGERDKAKPFM